MKRTFRFADFALDTAAGALRRGDETLPVTPKVYALLLALVERPGELLTKEELMARLWPDAVVEEANLSVTMSALRKALGEQPPEVRFIETVPRRGYRFVSPVQGFEAEPEAPPAPAAVRRGWVLPAIATAVLLAVAGATAWYFLRPAGAYRSLAVLPFRTTATDPATASLGLGMADSLIYRLAAAQTVTVRPTSSVLRFAAEPDPLAAGRTLGVDAVLTGFVQADGKKLRVTTQLLRVSDGKAVWSGQFENAFTNIFMVQDAIATRVADSLSMQLSGAARARMARRPTESTEAYKEFVIGRYFLSSDRRGENEVAMTHLRKAIALDPAFAQAYGALSEAMVDSLKTQATPEVRELARQNAVKALDLDPELARGHAALGGVQLWGDWNWSGAQASCAKAKELDPRDAVVRQFCGMLSICLTEFDTAIHELRTAAELDPDWREPQPFLSLAEMEAGFLEAAERRLLELRHKRPDDQFAIRLLAKLRWRQNRRAEAIALQREALQVTNLPIARGELVFFLAESGEREAARQVLPTIRSDNPEDPVAYARAMAHGALGEKDQAFQELDRAIQLRTTALVWMKFNLPLAPLRSDPRFASALGSLGFPAKR